MLHLVLLLQKYIPEIESSSLSVIGPVREDNQDSVRLLESAETDSVYAIADGMGGYAHGGVASLLALDSFFNTLMSHNGGSIQKALQRGMETANLHVYQKAQQLGVGRMGTTLTVAHVQGDMLNLAHIGDSRAYLIRDGRAICLTSDHTVVGDMVRSKIISADKIRTHSQRSILTKTIGISLFVQPDLIQKRLQEDDHLILCSDGLWSAIEDEDFAEVVEESSNPQEISQNLIQRALENNTDDNASVVNFHIRKLIPTSSDQTHQRESGGWFKKIRNMML